jgi:hypothetical protein
MVLIMSGLTAGASVPVETASGAAGLRVRDRLTWTQPDGTPVAFRPELRVWCGPWASDVAVPSIHVRVGSRSRAGLTHWELHAVVADVRRRPVVRLPNAFVFDHPKGALLFATDGRNEVNSDTQRSSGRIRFLRAGCGRRLQIAFRLDGRLGSEFSDGEPITVRGSFSASTSRA